MFFIQHYYIKRLKLESFFDLANIEKNKKLY